jgi:hypothetical protein
MEQQQTLFLERANETIVTMIHNIQKLSVKRQLVSQLLFSISLVLNLFASKEIIHRYDNHLSYMTGLNQSFGNEKFLLSKVPIISTNLPCRRFRIKQ